MRAARAAVYANKGADMPGNPFTCQRQARIFAKSYAQWQAAYWRMEALAREIEAAYGFAPVRRVYPPG